MKVWIDVANSPHPLLFAPIARRLAEQGATVDVTVRDHAQTAALAFERWPEAELIGEFGHGHGGRLGKAAALGGRIAALRRWARAGRPDVALSHNSYAQLVAARSLGIPAVTAMDFEYQPMNQVAFRCAERILVPEAVPTSVIRRQGATASKLIRYEGLKEELYLGDFTPQPSVLERVGVEGREGLALVVARTSAAGAMYHLQENPLLVRALRHLAGQADARCVVLVRLPEQRAEIAALGLPNVRMPDEVVDSRSLVWHANLFIGAGGTMTREAALIGTPTFSVFKGRQPAVDEWLMRNGALRRLTRTEEIGHVSTGTRSGNGLERLRARGKALVELFAQTAIATARMRS